MEDENQHLLQVDPDLGAWISTKNTIRTPWSWFYDRLLFGYFSPYMRLACDEGAAAVRPEKLPELWDTDKVEKWSLRFVEAARRQWERPSGPSRFPLIITLLRVFWLRFIGIFLIGVLHVGVTYASISSLAQFIRAQEIGKESLWTGIFWGAMAIFSELCKIFLTSQLKFWEQRVTLRVEGALGSTLFKRMLLQSNPTDQYHKNTSAKSKGSQLVDGKTSAYNVLMLDVPSVARSVLVFVQFCLAPVSVLTGFTILRKTDSGAAFVGVVVIFSILLCIFVVEMYNGYLKKPLLHARDVRIDKAHEALLEVKALRMMGWGDIAMESVQNAREMELQVRRGRMYLHSVSWILAENLQVIAQVAVICSYVLNGLRDDNFEFKASVAVPILQVMGKLVSPLTEFSFISHAMVESYVSIMRYQSYLFGSAGRVAPKLKAFKSSALTVTEDRIVGENDYLERKIDVQNGVFTWDKTDQSPAGDHENNGKTKARKERIAVDVEKLLGTDAKANAFQVIVPQLEVSRGECVFILGPSGSGKSSLLMGLLGEMNIVRGQVWLSRSLRQEADLFEGINVAHGALSTVGYVSQIPWIPEGSVRSIILFGRPFDPIRYQRTIAACQLIPDFDSWVDGDLKIVVQGGQNLSGGQRARIALARAIYDYPIQKHAPSRNLKSQYDGTSCYLLDDPCSSADPRVGASIFTYLFGESGLLQHGATVVAIDEQSLSFYMQVMTNGSIESVSFTDFYRKLPLLESSSLLDSINALPEYIQPRKEKEESFIDRAVESSYSGAVGVATYIWYGRRLNFLVWTLMPLLLAYCSIGQMGTEILIANWKSISNQFKAPIPPSNATTTNLTKSQGSAQVSPARDIRNLLVLDNVLDEISSFEHSSAERNESFEAAAHAIEKIKPDHATEEAKFLNLYHQSSKLKAKKGKATSILLPPSNILASMLNKRPNRNKVTKEILTEEELLKSTATSTEEDPWRSSATSSEEGPLKSSTTATEEDSLKSSATATGEDSLKSSATATGEDSLKSSATATEEDSLNSSATATEEDPWRSSATATEEDSLKSSATASEGDLLESSATATEENPLKSSATATEGDLLESSATATEENPLKSSATATEENPLKPSATATEEDPWRSTATEEDPWRSSATAIEEDPGRSSATATEEDSMKSSAIATEEDLVKSSAIATEEDPLKSIKFANEVIARDELNENVTQTMTALLIFIALSSSNVVASLLNTITQTWGSLKASKKIHDQLLHSVMRAPFWLYDFMTLGSIVNRFSTDIQQVDVAPIYEMAKATKACIKLVLVVIVLCLVTPVLAPLVPILLVVVYFYVYSIYRPTIREFQRSRLLAFSPLCGILSEVESGAVVIRALGGQQFYSQKNIIYTENLMKAQFMQTGSNNWAILRLELIAFPMLFASVFFRPILNYFSWQPVSYFQAWMGAQTVAASAGAIGLAIDLAGRLPNLIGSILLGIAFCERAMCCVQRVRELAESTEAAKGDTKGMSDAELAIQTYKDFPSRKTGIRLDNVTVAYQRLLQQKDSSDTHEVSGRYRREYLQPSLKNISVTASPGEYIGIVGRTGSGKSTLLLSLINLVELRTGSITIDGVSLSNMSNKALWQLVGVLPQYPVVLKGFTVRRFLDPHKEFNANDLWMALNRVGMENEIRNLPRALDTPLYIDEYESDTGTEEEKLPSFSNDVEGPTTAVKCLSDSQLRILSLARLSLKANQYRLILVDEPPTRQLDTATEKPDAETSDILKSVFDKSIVITVAHHASTLKNCDTIWILSNGKLVGKQPGSLVTSQESLMTIIANAESSHFD